MLGSTLRRGLITAVAAVGLLIGSATAALAAQWSLHSTYPPYSSMCYANGENMLRAGQIQQYQCVLNGAVRELWIYA